MSKFRQIDDVRKLKKGNTYITQYVFWSYLRDP